MGVDYLYNILLSLVAIVVLVLNISASGMPDKYWWCNPNGFFSIPLFLSSAGFPIFYLVYGRYPELYGVEDSNIVFVNGCLVVSAVFYTVGTFVSLTPRDCFVEVFSIDAKTNEIFDLLLRIVVIVLCVVLWFSLATTGQLDASSYKYGQNQWSRVGDAPWLRISVLLVPMLAAYVLLRVLNTGRFPWLFFLSMAALVVYPAIKSGGRKDVLFVALTFITAYSIKVGRIRFVTLLISALVAASLNYIQVVVRENFGDDASIDISEMAGNQKEENRLAGQILTIMPIAPTLSSAMVAFPKMQDYGLGSTYFESALGTFVPKIVTEEFNFGSPNQKFHDLYYPEITDFSMDYSMAAESYQNFGVVGVVGAYFLFGVAMANAFRVFKANRRGLVPGLYMVFFFSAIWSIRSDSNTFMKTFCYPAVLLFAVFFAAKRVRRIVQRVGGG